MDGEWKTRINCAVFVVSDNINVFKPEQENMEVSGRKERIVSYFIPDDEPDKMIRLPSTSDHNTPCSSQFPPSKSSMPEASLNTTPTQGQHNQG